MYAFLILLTIWSAPVALAAMLVVTAVDIYLHNKLVTKEQKKWDAIFDNMKNNKK